MGLEVLGLYLRRLHWRLRIMVFSSKSVLTEGIRVQWRHGIWLPDYELALDPRRPSELAFVSHAHSDHTGHHACTLATPATARLMRARFGSGTGTFVELPYDHDWELGSARVRLLPAGHIFGSAQLYLCGERGDLLYTGDFKLREGLSSDPARFCRAQTLILEATFGLPRYCFPPSWEVMERIRAFCRQALEDGDTPILLGYSLGKAQELIRVLAGEGMQVVLHPAVWEMTRLVRELEGADAEESRWPEVEKYTRQPLTGRVLICPPSLQGSMLLRKIPRRQVAMISGWALEPGAVHRYQCDAAFPLSDHADYPDLLRAVELVQPQRIFLVHGFAREFAADLRQRGYEAWALGQSDQLELSLAVEQPARGLMLRVPGAPTDSGWGRFCAVAEAIGNASGRIRKVELLSDYLRRLTDADLPRALAWFSGRTFPDPSESGVVLGPVVLRKALCKVAGVAEGVFRQQARWQPDLGVAAARFLPEPAAAVKLELSEMVAFLHRLAASRGVAARMELLREQLEKMSPIEAGYLCKVLLGDLRIGLREGLIVEAIAQAFAVPQTQVAEAVMLLGDAGRVAVLARARRLEEVGLVLFRPLQVMLAGVEPDAESVWQRFASEESAAPEVWVEDKFDGIRAQIHHQHRRTEIFSREGRNLTGIFPEIVQALEEEAGTFVLDGEILGWVEGRVLPFAELQKRLGRNDPDFFLTQEVPVQFFAFDLLYLPGQTLFRRPLSERRELLENLRLPEPLAVPPRRVARSAKEIEAAFLAAKARGHEGLVLKDPSSAYTPGRRGLSWIKLKKAQATLDVVIVAAQYGHGKRAGLLSDYTFAVRGEAGALLPIGKAYTGLRDAEIEELTAELLALEMSREHGRITVRPAIVLEVAFDSIRPSSRHASGLALRFPRIKRVRRDKSPADADTLETAWSLVPPAEKAKSSSAASGTSELGAGKENGDSGKNEERDADKRAVGQPSQGDGDESQRQSHSESQEADAGIYHIAQERNDTGEDRENIGDE